MKTNLAYINEVASAAVADPPVRRTEHYSVGALRLSREVEIPKRSYQSYRADESLLRERLALCGVSPLAVLPTQWWDKMCKDAGLVTIRARQDQLNLHPDNDAGGTVMLGVMSWVGLGVASGTALCLGTDWSWFPATVVSLGGLALCHVASWPFIVRAYARLAIRLGGGRDKVLLRMLNDDRGKSVKVGFSLPPAPTGVAANIGGLDFGHVHVTAEPSAFLLDKSLDRVVRDQITQWFFSKGEALGELMSDPIVTYQLGTAVAVIAQWGEFPIEQELVGRVVATPLV